MRARYVAPLVSVGLLWANGPVAIGQVAYPDHTIQDVEWTNGTHHTAVTQKILSPSDPSLPVTISGAADAEFVSGTQVHMTDGFHAGVFTGNGRFRARIDQGLGPDADLAVIAPDPATHMVDSVLHVEKWEKLEVGLRLPQDYQDAITRFFAHYYSNGDTNTVTPAMVDHGHDLNPYADDSLQLVITLTSPSGAQKMKWGFFMKEATWANTADTAWLVENMASPLHPYTIRFRFAPDEEGLWQFELSVKAPHTTSLSNDALAPLRYTGYTFACDPPLPDNKGFLHVNEVNRRTLQFETGEPFFGLGTNLADIGDRRIDHDHIRQAMEDLHSVGSNYLRMWLMRHHFAPEWVNLGVYDHYREEEPCTNWVGPAKHLGNCQYQCWYFDQVLEHARDNDMYIQLCVDPCGPGIAYEIPIWGSNAYVIHFVEPASQSRPYDLKEYFYKDGNPANINNGVFYYWKRKYKYILARWGYSVNISAIEPFNETDQMLSYGTDSLANYSQTSDTYYSMCPENRITWTDDPLLPITINNWLTDIAHFIRDPVDTANLAQSPLGDSTKLILMSYAGGAPANTSDTNYYLPLRNPNVDIADVHRYLYWGEMELAYSFDLAQAYRNVFLSNGNKKPFQNGEFGTWGTSNDDDSFPYFSNYDVSFHNEIWASTFFGNFATSSSWFWARVFWWEDNLQPPPPDFGANGNQWQQIFSSAKGATNLLDIGIIGGYPVVNKPIYHNFSPLMDMLSNPTWQQYAFFNGNFKAQKVYDDQANIECYYLTNADQNVAIGWVHNLNAYWANNFYVTRANQNFLGCTDPNSQSILLDNFQTGVDQYVTYFPTRVNSAVYPTDQLDDDGNGWLVLDLSTAPLNGIADFPSPVPPYGPLPYLDTLHSDYGFIITPQPMQRRMIPINAADTIGFESTWDFGIYPNPARDAVNLLLPADGFERDIAIYDLTGKRIFSWNGVTDRMLGVTTGGLARGAYCIRVSHELQTKMKTLILD